MVEMTSTTMKEVIEQVRHRLGYNARWELYSLLIDEIPSVKEQFECQWEDRAYDEILKRNHPFLFENDFEDEDWEGE